ncbi:hypothetical protein AA0119_g3174 [Alternaria tenuissima]|jgi:hypothetical protein|uniref:Uncharacterized protein n=2 Tax=Alternaria alternata complex TaxID=187734 RepID=A0A4Q4NML7_ALTAL|nr:hypothetical protein B0T12DRAFT_142375 [Alternaria alternata]RYN60469.1 hypothetical protein AA0118_g6246 [Alternaria tenuissima]RYN79694.1 hypothetical protein AA0117_g3668 [Alternaria alternata]RYO05459.1 hypothetical protein AA0119_g3174 [Alternaria tenuissima]RYO20747.1 hypothetical protein AA0121_g3516 [Alternaria tenuissima]
MLSTQEISTSAIVGLINSSEPTLSRDCPSCNSTVYPYYDNSGTYLFLKLYNDAYNNSNGRSSHVKGQVNGLVGCVHMCAKYNHNNHTEVESNSNKKCTSVCWRNTFGPENDFPEELSFGFTTIDIMVNGQTAFDLAEDRRNICDSAVWINPDFS